ncbi:hypothetical protein ABZ760_25500 [Streptomyces sp. NPDC006658]
MTGTATVCPWPVMDAEDDGATGEHDQDQDGIAEPAPPPLTTMQADPGA